MIRNKHAFRGVNCALLAFIAIMWLAVLAPAKLQVGITMPKANADSLNKVNPLKEVRIKHIISWLQLKVYSSIGPSLVLKIKF